MNSPDPREARSFELSAGAPSLVIEDEGFRVHRGRRRTRAPLEHYSDITHLGVSSRGLWIATARHIQFLRRNRFRDTDGPEEAAREIVRRIVDSPGGLRQMQSIAEIDERARRGSARRVTASIALLCVVVHFLQVRDPFLMEVGSFVPDLVARGEWWRILTANVIHGLASIPMHLTLNMVGLLSFALLVERPLGSLRTALILGLSAFGGIGACAIAGYAEVVGASTLVAGLVGAAMCLEFQHAAKLPTWWRLPRGPFVAVVVAQAVIDQFVPMIAAAAHIGSFVAGYLAARMLAPSAFRDRDRGAPRWAVPAVGALVVASLLSIASIVPFLTRDPGALDRYARHLLDVPGMPATRYNDLAWRIVTEARPPRDQLDAALALAERAADRTDRLDPDVLDTLAEVHFARGEAERALSSIDAAIALSPQDDYFREQRRRFTGDRDADDRPEAPDLPWLFRRPPEWRTPDDFEPGLRI